MHPTIEYEIAQALIADRQRQAGQPATARAAGRARRALALRHPRPAAGLARRVLAPLATRGRAAREHSRPRAACPPTACRTSCA